MKKIILEKFSQFKLSRKLSPSIKGGYGGGVPCGCIGSDSVVSCVNGLHTCRDKYLGSNYYVSCQNC